ncbi:MAG: hypothetical protein BGO31_16285 [Bacteroidetes bacterium 43-16]|nr:MAG: hypothetical protein BGO31_16285 [Bacteroidetes bacterium 43-16]
MKQQRVVLIGFLLMLFMVFPLITVFDTYKLIWGIPVQAVYIFGVWVLAVLAIALVVMSKKIKK